jgi:hypothetical protein
LGSLDATAAAFSTDRNDFTEMTNLVLLLQRQVAEGVSGDGGEGHPAPGNGAHDELSAKVDALHHRMFGLQDHAPKIAEFEAQLAQLRSELDKATTAASDAPPLPPPVLSGPDSETLAKVDGLAAQLEEIGERLRVSEELQGQVGQLAERVSVNDAEARAVREHMAMLDQRLTNVSMELANQLSELGNDIDGLGQRLPEGVDSAVNDEVVDALRGGQVKLANEQARYEIAFRQDLATLAEQLRQGRDDTSEDDAG